MDRVDYAKDFVAKTEQDACDMYPGFMNIMEILFREDGGPVLVKEGRQHVLSAALSKHIMFGGTGTGQDAVWSLRESFWRCTAFQKYLQAEFESRENKLSVMEDSFAAIQSEMIEIEELLID